MHSESVAPGLPGLRSSDSRLLVLRSEEEAPPIGPRRSTASEPAVTGHRSLRVSSPPAPPGGLQV